MLLSDPSDSEYLVFRRVNRSHCIKGVKISYMFVQNLKFHFQKMFIDILTQREGVKRVIWLLCLHLSCVSFPPSRLLK